MEVKQDEMLKIIGMGTGTANSITLGALAEMQNARRVVLQTDRVPAADFLKSYGIDFETIDDVYSTAQDFDELCELAADKIEEGVFCVLGSISSNLIAQEVIKKHPAVSYTHLDVYKRQIIYWNQL